jgi:hypothetical protein
MSGQEILSRSALDLAHLIRARQVSSEDVVRVSLDRIARLNPSVQAFVSVFETAINVARAKDRQTLRGGTLPLFHGVPIGIKDLNVVRWSRTRFGSRAVPSLPMPWDDLTVAPLRRAGFVILGKLSTSEFGALPVTEPVIHRPTRNPWALSRSAGGSSGGSAAAVAAEMLPVSQGSDGAGSSPCDFLDRLADLVPPPRKHRHRYHGVFAPNHKLRSAVTALAIGDGTSNGGFVPHGVADHAGIAPGQEARAVVTFELDRSALVPPAETAGLRIPEKPSRDLREFLGPSPYIESRHGKIVRLAKEVAADLEPLPLPSLADRDTARTAFRCHGGVGDTALRMCSPVSHV